MLSAPHLTTLTLLVVGVFTVSALPDKSYKDHDLNLRNTRSVESNIASSSENQEKPQNFDPVESGSFTTDLGKPVVSHDPAGSIFGNDYAHILCSKTGCDDMDEESSASGEDDGDLTIRAMKEFTSSRKRRSFDVPGPPNWFLSANLRDFQDTWPSAYPGETGPYFPAPRSRKWITQIADRVPHSVYLLRLVHPEGQPGSQYRRSDGRATRGRIVETADGRRYRITPRVITLYE
ncbi:uncharacterized protein LOC124155074 isoform X2 [Ischnura elegans]|uniref:uncharacterized protein LOC124155074 isoform X2 n=1 Tax=Ischnura elegans TaxID=197161 RepID=UPI001ED87790|nr:uncharacterized protein LOC124155074 isoform X2 [Ischnura elegans]